MAPPKKKRVSRGILADNAWRVLVVWFLLVLALAAAAFTRPLWLGIVIFSTGVLLFLLSCYYVARTRLFPGRANRSELYNGWRAYLGWLLGLHHSSYLVENVTTRRTITGGARVLPGVVLVDGHSAVVTHKRGTHQRVLGPGVHVLQRGETIRSGGDGSESTRVREAVDLRRQSRAQPLKAQTRDGLFVKTTLFAVFQIDRDPDPALDERNFFRFHSGAVHKVVEAERVGTAGEVFDWTSMPLSLAHDAALQIISTYTLDELYAPRGDHGTFRPADMRRNVGDQIGQEIRNALKAHGIHLLAAGVSKIEPDDTRVTRQRVLNWRATHQRNVNVLEAQSLAVAETMREEARGKAQTRLLNAILMGLSSARGQSRALLQLRLAAALERMFEAVPGEAVALDAPVAEKPRVGI